MAWSRSEATRVFRRAKKKAAVKRGSLGRMRSYSRGTDSGLRERQRWKIFVNVGARGLLWALQLFIGGLAFQLHGNTVEAPIRDPPR